MDRYDYMNEAVSCAMSAATTGDIPVGAVIVKDGKIIAKGENRRQKLNNPMLHAEVVAIEDACNSMQSSRLDGCEMYVTLEPCPMCAGAIINSGISKVVFGAFDPKNGACGSVTDLFVMPFTHRVECYGGVCEDKCATLLESFFRSMRGQDANIKK